MNCREFTDFLEAWFADELPEIQRNEFGAHLQDCPPCVHFLASYRTTIELGRLCVGDNESAAVPEVVPEELIQAILTARRKGR